MPKSSPSKITVEKSIPSGLNPNSVKLLSLHSIVVQSVAEQDERNRTGMVVKGSLSQTRPKHSSSISSDKHSESTRGGSEKTTQLLLSLPHPP